MINNNVNHEKKLSLSTILFFMLLLNVILMPFISHISFFPVRLITNIVEYGFCVLTIVYCILLACLNRLTIGKSSAVLFVFAFYAFVCFAAFSKKNIETFSMLFNIFECFCFYVVGKNEINSKKRLNVFIIVSIFSILMLFASSIIYNINSLSNIVEAFSGGRYRLGNLESQANGYALYCFYLSVLFILFYSATGKRIFLLLPLLPSLICIGTQSKKGILLCFVISIFSIYLFLRGIRKKRIKIACFIIVPSLLIVALIFVVIKTDLFSRFFQKGDDSTITRLMMYRYLFFDFDVSFLVGKGTNSFKDFFYLNNGTNLVFHSTFGDTFYSYGFIGFFLWVSFLFCVYYRKKEHRNNIWFVLLIIMSLCQIVMDLTSMIWYIPFSFIMLSLFSNKYLFVYTPIKSYQKSYSGDYICLEI